MVVESADGKELGTDETFTTHLLGGTLALPDGRLWELVHRRRRTALSSGRPKNMGEWCSPLKVAAASPTCRSVLLKAPRVTQMYRRFSLCGMPVAAGPRKTSPRLIGLRRVPQSIQVRSTRLSRQTSRWGLWSRWGRVLPGRKRKGRRCCRKPRRKRRFTCVPIRRSRLNPLSRKSLTKRWRMAVTGRL